MVLLWWAGGDEAWGQRNVVLLVADDLGWKDLGCYGSEFIESPQLDRLADEGARFTDAYAAAAICSPSRAAIHTGRWPARVGVTDWIPGHDPRDRPLLGAADRHALPREEATTAELLRARGYRTFFAGKWHLGRDSLPEAHGFEVNVGGIGRGSPPGGYHSPYRNPRLPDGPEGEVLPDRLARETAKFIESVAGQPFFAQLSFYAPHLPIEAVGRHLPRYEEKARRLGLEGKDPFVIDRDGFTRAIQSRADYASLVQAVDDAVGHVVDTLERLGLREETLIVFTSDNGGLSTRAIERGRAGVYERNPTSNRPLRAGKGYLYEGGLRVPLILAGSWVDGSGAVVAEPVSGIDLLPTIMDAAGVEPGARAGVDGRSLLPLLRRDGGAASGFMERPLFWHYPHYHGSGETPAAAARLGKWKYVVHYETRRFELFDLSEDLGEALNVAAAYPMVAEQLHGLLVAWQAEVGAAMPMVNPSYR